MRLKFFQRHKFKCFGELIHIRKSTVVRLVFTAKDAQREYDGEEYMIFHEFDCDKRN